MLKKAGLLIDQIGSGGETRTKDLQRRTFVLIVIVIVVDDADLCLCVVALIRLLTCRFVAAFNIPRMVDGRKNPTSSSTKTPF